LNKTNGALIHDQLSYLRKLSRRETQTALWRKEEAIASDFILAEISFRWCDPFVVIKARFPRLVEYRYVLNVAFTEVINVKRPLNPYGPQYPVAHVLIEPPASHILHESRDDSYINI
jgi:hypothetical protein